MIDRVKLMLSSQDVRCLILLDGLDEYTLPAGYEGLPNMYGIVNSVLLCTTRPWKLVQLSLKFHKLHDKVVEIFGLLPDSVNKVIEYVLVNFYGLKTDSTDYSDKFERYSKMVSNSALEPLMKIPMMLTALCYMWCEEDSQTKQTLDTTSDEDTQPLHDAPVAKLSMTFTYLSLIEAMFERASEKYDLKSLLGRTCPLAQVNIPKIVAEFSNITSYMFALLPFCRLAYTDLVSDDTQLVFRREQLEKEIGYPLVQLALRVGLISQSKAPGKLHQRNISVNFYHKTIQEFLAAMYLVTGPSDIVSKFCSRCGSLNAIFEMSNVTLFAMGLDHVKGCILSKHVIDAVNNDINVKTYRKLLYCDFSSNVRQLYKTQYAWYKEITHTLSITHDSLLPSVFQVSDIYLDNETLELTVELITSNTKNIESVFLDDIDQGSVCCVLEHLPQCSRLSALKTSRMYSIEEYNMLKHILPKLAQLDTLWYNGAILPLDGDLDLDVVDVIITLTQLRTVVLRDIDMRGCFLVWPDNWEQLEMLFFVHMKLNAFSWMLFVCSLAKIPHSVEVSFIATNIDDNTFGMICNSPHFMLTLLNDGRDIVYTYAEIQFLTIPSQITLDLRERNYITSMLYLLLIWHCLGH